MSKKPLKQSDIFTHLLDAKDPNEGTGLCTDELAAESTNLIIAGKSYSSQLATSLC
jgi:hypothetical protein